MFLKLAYLRASLLGQIFVFPRGNYQPIVLRQNTLLFNYSDRPRKIPEWIVVVNVSLKALANEDTLLRTHCCRQNCFPVCPRVQHLLRTQKMFLILFRNILCPQQMFPSLRSPRNIMGNNVEAGLSKINNWNWFKSVLSVFCFKFYIQLSWLSSKKVEQ